MCFIDHDENLELNSLFYGQPVEVYEFRSDGVKFPFLGNDPGRSTLNILKSGFKRLVNSNQKAVAIVEPRSHKSVDR